MFFYTTVLLYLTHLSPCRRMGAALQSVIYVYRWPCGQELDSRFTQVIRPLDRSEAGGKHISFLNGVFGFSRLNFFSHLLRRRSSYFLSAPVYLASWCHRRGWEAVSPGGLQVWAKEKPQSLQTSSDKRHTANKLKPALLHDQCYYAAWTSGIIKDCSHLIQLLFTEFENIGRSVIGCVRQAFDGLCCMQINASSRKGRDFSRRKLPDTWNALISGMLLTNTVTSRHPARGWMRCLNKQRHCRDI